MRALRSLLAVALLVAAVAVGCSNRYSALCDHEEACAEEEGSMLRGGFGMTFQQTCEARLPYTDDAVPDVCVDCVLNLPCDVLNDCLLHKNCHEANIECAAVCR